MECEHENFKVACAVARLEDIGRFMLEINVHCAQCGTPFRFLGLKPGLDLNGATVSLDGMEANIAICPKGAQPSPLQGIIGYTVKGTN